jgi:hypothetical protein
MKSFRELYIDSFIHQEFLYFAMIALSSLNISFAIIQQFFKFCTSLQRERAIFEVPIIIDYCAKGIRLSD